MRAAGILALVVAAPLLAADAPPARRKLGREVSVEKHLQDDDEFRIPLPELLAHGTKLFMANWTWQEGAGRPMSKGTGVALSDPNSPLAGPRSFNRVSGPDAHSCATCHNPPYGHPGVAGDSVTH